MPRIPFRRALGAASAVAAVALTLTGAAGAFDSGSQSSLHKPRTSEPLVVRGQDTVSETGPCPGGVCTLELTDGAFRGTPVGTGAYAGTIKLAVGDAFSNGEGGLCAPIRGAITLGIGTPDRLRLAVTGDSCQDGDGPLDEASFTGLARFTVVHGTGAYARASGHGIASFAEDAADRQRTTLIGRITR